VTSQSYDTAGRVESVTDPKGLISKSFYDALGRTTKVIENYVDGTPSNADDKTVEFTYDGSSNRKTLKVYLAGGGYQTTEWIYGVNTTTGSDIASNDIVSAMRYPDKTTGNASSSEQETYTVNALGDTKTSTDRNGTVHTFTRDVLGRLISDAVTTVGSGVDGAIRRIDTAYDTVGRASLHTSYDAASGGNIVNQIQQEYNGLGQMTREYQAVNGAVNTSTTPYVAYTYSEMSGGANHSRLVSMTYPNGRVINYNYGSGLNSTISRLDSMSDTSGTLESYSYLGLDTVVRRAHALSGIDQTFIKLATESNGDAGDQYIGLDRFDRIVDHRWQKTSDNTFTDRFQYGHDRNSNRLYRENALNAIFSELYQYDGLNQLTSMERGQLNGTKTAITGTPSRAQSWTFDALGNFTTQVSDGVTQTRTHNRQNQITSISGATIPIYSLNGEMTTDEQGQTLKYDAWGRLIEVKQGSIILASYSHDALNRKVTDGNRALYHSADWQVVEERASGLVVVQTVFSPVYVDALILRDRDTDGNGSLDERLWAQQDANFNVTAITNGSTVVERLIADAYGTPTILTGAWGARSATLFAWVNLHQGGRSDAATGMFDFRNRWLSPSLGRWNRNDPIGFAAGDYNLYRALHSNPCALLDPSGLQRQPTWFENMTGFGKNKAWAINWSNMLAQEWERDGYITAAALMLHFLKGRGGSYTIRGKFLDEVKRETEATFSDVLANKLKSKPGCGCLPAGHQFTFTQDVRWWTPGL
jgi:RHS repeat-associated protein